MKSLKKAFSLLELAIVVAIIGLLISGVTIGSNLIENAKKNKVLSDIATIKTAIDSFYLIYKQLPGDYDNAVAKWEAYNAASAPNGTVNGNGDKVLEWNGEGLRVFHHLQLANIVSGIYNSSSSGNNAMNIDSSNANVKKAPYQNSAYAFYNEALNGVTSNYIVVGAMISNAGITTNKDGVMSSVDAFSLDQKIDDGIPSNGNLRASYAVNKTNNIAPNGTNCINGKNDQTDLEYLGDSDLAPACILYFTINVN